jgi:hypothetical protein
VVDRFVTGQRVQLHRVAYLAEAEGSAGFLESLARWAEHREEEIRRIENGWRAWLGRE